MILDKVSNSQSYVNTHPLFAKAFEYLEEYLKNPVAPGKYEICSEDLYVVVQEYETRELINKMYQGSADLLVASLIGQQKLSGDEITRLKALVSQLEG